MLDLKFPNSICTTDSKWGSNSSNYRAQLRSDLLRDFSEKVSKLISHQSQLILSESHQKTKSHLSEKSSLSNKLDFTENDTNKNLNLTENDQNTIHDLEKPLVKIQNIFISISHSRSLGGYILSLNPIGFDLEEKSRINQKIVSRISLQQEIQTSPRPEFLWVAKEATFKCCIHLNESYLKTNNLSNSRTYVETFQKPTVIGEVEIHNWNQIELNMFQFKAKLNSSQNDLNGTGIVIDKNSYLLSIFYLN